ncbi:PIN domain-containing protein [Streptomyces sp. OUCMDZ-4982]|uniref:PIN domain-containing protein n=1 Tax=Streptomyces sp. OUCMDZ-4982 TaxID=2973090 RepID=UPI00215BE3DA|nr:PIN domain-containing protein [Streptomyces sp. OUCMDZ-4982]MCR8941525.1 PIN domain-containing protein [Streptomyces sp. OUCMDZ-4982]
MLIFDTNAVHGLDPHGAKADLLRLLSQVGLKVSAPWVVLEELTAHKLYDYQRAFDLMRRQHIELSNLEPNLAGPVPKFNGDRFASYWRSQYSEIFTTIPTSESALKQSVLREAASMKPAKADKSKKSGSRDVAIWFSILEYMEQNPKEDVFFVSNNTADFGGPEDWPFPLDIDLGDKVSRITHLVSFDEVIDKFTTSSEAPAGVAEALTRRLSDKASTSGMMHELWIRHLRRMFRSNSKRLPSSRYHIALEPKLTGAIECKSIGSSTWYWSKVAWCLYALEAGTSEPLIASWDTSILFPHEEEGRISLLRSGRLAEIGSDDLSQYMQSALADSISYESVRMNEVGDQVDGHEFQESLDLESTLPVDPPVSVKSVRRWSLRASESAFQYERAVLDAIRRTVGEPEYARNADAGVDAFLATPEGVIGIEIKHGSTLGRLRPSNSVRTYPHARPYGARGVDAVLTVTSQPINALSVQRTLGYTSSIGRIDPALEETVSWAGREDDTAITRAVHGLRHALRARES